MDMMIQGSARQPIYLSIPVLVNIANLDTYYHFYMKIKTVLHYTNNSYNMKKYPSNQDKK